MASNRTINQLREVLTEKINKAGEFWLDRQPARMGNYNRVVEVPNSNGNGMVFVRLINGQVIQVFNNVAPNIWNWSVFIGRDKSQPGLWKVVEARWLYNIRDTFNYIVFHHKQHEFPAPDTVFIYRDQFMPLLVFPAGGMTAQLFGDVIYAAGMTTPLRVPDTVIDMSGHIPVSGAEYVLLEIEFDGTFNYVTGANFATREILIANGPIPTPSANAIPVCAFVMFSTQTEIRRDSERRDIIDLRMFTSPSSDIHVHVYTLDDLDDVDAPTPSIDDTLVFNGTDWVAEPKAKVLKIVMRPDVSDPPEPVLTPDGLDYVYYEE